MNSKLDKQNILRLDVKDNIINKLNNNNISKLGELCSNSEADLRSYNLNDNEIDSIKEELRQIGMILRS